MWERQKLKAEAKISFQKNYWRCVLISLLLFLGGGSFLHPAAAASSGGGAEEKVSYRYEIEDITPKDLQLFLEENDIGEEYLLNAEHVAVFAAVIMVVGLFIFVFAVLLSVFIGNPLEVGCKRFYVKNLEGQAQVKEAAFGFDRGYRNIVKILFYRDLYTLLWSLLFLVPGIVKSYEYLMVPYLLADNPDMTGEEAFRESKRMMDGNKWRTFVMHLSFLGWEILSLFTFGFLHILYVQPYVDATNAGLYRNLRGLNGNDGR